ncbi:serine hydrolase domain-containing protein [Rhodovarius sp.]|uniref:serine hydrolase domain-containing protein n=1 Tax=Rhodovarius sp. TaxID=2972673 RepID=UPI00334221D5
MRDLDMLRLERRVGLLLVPHDEGPGVAVGVARDAELLLRRQSGMASIELRQPITAQTCFRIASVSKQFTCAAILILAAEGMLSVRDPVGRYLPGLPGWAGHITLDQLMRNTAGLRDMLELLRAGGVDLSHSVPAAQIDRAIARSEGVNFPAGARFLYSNTNFWLLGQVIERVSRMALADFLQDRIFRPLGMTRTCHTPDVMTPVEGLATGYMPSGDGFVRAGHGFALGGEGGMVSGVEDLALWARALSLNLLGGGVLEPQMEVLAPFTNGTMNSYARGVEVDDWRGLKLVSHGGLWPGFKTAFMRVPARRLTVIVITNHGGLDAGAMGMAVLEAALEAEPVLHPVAALPLPSGCHVTEEGVSLDLWLDEAGRPMARQHGVAFALGPRQDGRLHALRGGFRFALEARDGGHVLHGDAGHSSRLRRVEPGPGPDLAGRFHCADLDTAWHLAGDGTWRIDGPLAKAGPFRIEGLGQDLARFHMPGRLYDPWWDVRFERDDAGEVTTLVASGARAWGFRFERV